MIAHPRRLFRLRFASLAVGLLACAQLMADDKPQAVPLPSNSSAYSGDSANLHCLSLCELDELFRRGRVGETPHGWFPGEVIAFTNMLAPKTVKKLADAHWMGKHIEQDGSFINQWKRGKALSSCLTVGPSFLDGEPCFIFEYPRWTPLFGPMRDEYREIAPGLYLGRMYRRVPHVRFLGYNFLRLSETGGCTSGMLTQAESGPLVAAEPDPVARESSPKPESRTEFVPFFKPTNRADAILPVPFGSAPAPANGINSVLPGASRPPAMPATHVELIPSHKPANGMSPAARIVIPLPPLPAINAVPSDPSESIKMALKEWESASPRRR